MRRTAPSNLKRAHLLGRILLGAVCATLLVQAAEADAGRPNAASSTRGQQKPPKITSLKPATGAAGTTVTVSGSNFTGASAVAFKGTRAGYTVKSSNTIIAQVPVGAGSGPVTVTTRGGNATSSYSFTVTSSSISPPTVTGISPSTATPGTTVTLFGANFTGASAVAFNGATASFTVTSSGQITATVPASATSGPITVTTSAGTGTSTVSFTVDTVGLPAGLPPGIFISPTGSDTTGNGSISQPFATLAKAQEAMRSGGPQITYIRAGYYSLPPVTQNGVSYGLHLTAADSGQTWSHYPPDGNNNAILDGGSTSSSTGIHELITIDGASHVTINGLQLQHFRWIGIGVHGGGGFYQLFPAATTMADGTTITNNLIHDGSYDLSPIFGYGGGAFYAEGNLPNTTVANNAIYNIAAFGIEAQVGNAGQGGNVSSLLISNNAVLSTCQSENDCGAIYVQDTNTTSTGVRITNNFIRDTGTPSLPARSIYLDDGLSGASVTDNVIAAGLYVWAFTIHGGSNNRVSSNIVDLGPNNNREILLYQGDGLNAMTGNRVEGNLIVSGGAGGGYEGQSFGAQPTIANNTYFHYAGSPIYTGGYFGLKGDTSPVIVDPQMSCWTYALAGGSPLYDAPTSLDVFPRRWGPPGYTIPQTGTPPSQPHTC